MNLQCPSCLKPLTVPDQFAGQMMKCPLCGSTFSVPATGGTVEALPPLSNEPPPPAPTAQTPTVSTLGPAPTPSSTPTPTTAPVPTAPGSPATSGKPSEGYENTCAMRFKPEVMRWVAPVCLVLIFFLQFFPWVGLYPGGVGMATQGAWGAAFGGYSYDEDDPLFKRMYGNNGLPEDQAPGVSSLMIFYVLLFLPTLVLTVAVLLLELGVLSARQIPPAVQPLLQWRWGAVAALNLLVFLLLALQMVFGFALETKVATKARESVATMAEEAAKKKEEMSKKEQAMAVGVKTQTVSRTNLLWAALWLHVLAVIGAWTAYCLHDRPGKPYPKLELEW